MGTFVSTKVARVVGLVEEAVQLLGLERLANICRRDTADGFEPTLEHPLLVSAVD
jgi:hypothetical protein